MLSIVCSKQPVVLRSIKDQSFFGSILFLKNLISFDREREICSTYVCINYLVGGESCCSILREMEPLGSTLFLSEPWSVWEKGHVNSATFMGGLSFHFSRS